MKRALTRDEASSGQRELSTHDHPVADDDRRRVCRRGAPRRGRACRNGRRRRIGNVHVVRHQLLHAPVQRGHDAVDVLPPRRAAGHGLRRRRDSRRDERPLRRRSTERIAERDRVRTAGHERRTARPAPHVRRDDHRSRCVPRAVRARRQLHGDRTVHSGRRRDGRRKLCDAQAGGGHASDDPRHADGRKRPHGDGAGLEHAADERRVSVAALFRRGLLRDQGRNEAHAQAGPALLGPQRPHRRNGHRGRRDDHERVEGGRVR